MRKITIKTCGLAALLAALVLALPRGAEAHAEPARGFAYDIPVMQEAGGEISPSASNLLVRVNRDLAATAADGSVISDLPSFDLQGRVPVYYVSNMYAADALAGYINETSAVRAMVCSSNPQLVARVREKAPSVRGMLDCRRSACSSRAEWEDIHTAVMQNSASAVLLAGDVSADAIFFLRRLSVAVWVETDTPARTVSAAVAGASGLFSSDPAAVKSALSALPAGTVARPMLVAHRGLSGARREDGTAYLENTLEAARSAVEYGADIIELDVYLSADGRLVVMHDPSLTRTTNGSGNIETMTLAEIRRYKVGGRDEIPVLDDYFAEFKDKDVNIFVELKGNKPEIVHAVAQKIEEYGFASQCTVIAFDINYLAAARGEMAGVSLGLLDDYKSGSDDISALKRVNSVNSTFNPDYHNMTEEKIFEFARCGVSVWPWTLTDADSFNRFYTIGAGGLTFEDCSRLADWPKSLLPETQTPDVLPYEDFTLGVLLDTFGHTPVETAYDIAAVEGDVEIVMTPSGYLRAEGEGTALVVFTVSHASPDYAVVSGVVEITSAAPAPDSPVPPVESEKEGSGCSGAFTASSLAAFVLLAAGLSARKRRP